MNKATRTAQSDYITHAMRCTRCTTAARLPGAKRRRPGAELRRAYTDALPPPVKYETDRRKTQ